MGAGLLSIFDTTGFPARWHCGRWSEQLGWLHIVSDLLIFGAYMAIPLGLAFFTRQRRDLPKPFPIVFWLFGAFIVACGLTHLIEAIIFWHPIYRFAGVVKASTALVSWTTLAFLVPAIPQALALRSPAQLQRQVHEATTQLRTERDAAARLASIVESSHDAIFSQDLEGTIETWNPGAVRLFRHQADEIVGRSIMLLVPEPQRPELLRTLERARESQQVEELESDWQRRDGTHVAVSLTISPYFNQAHELAGVSVIARDISARRKVEALFRAVVEAAPSGMIAVDAGGNMVLVNTEAERLFGYEQRELVGQPIEKLVPEDLRSLHTHLRASYIAAATPHGTSLRREISGRRKDGTVFPAEIGLNLIALESESLILSAIVDRTELHQEREAIEAKTAELQRSNEELEQFAYVASHDLQEPLRMVVTFMALLKRNYASTLDDKALKYIDFAVDGSERMKQLVDDLLSYSRIDSCGHGFAQVDGNVTLRNALQSLSLRIEETGTRIRADELPTVWGDAVQLEQVFQNLIANAIKFRGERAPEISIGCTTRTNEWELHVSDNGIGFDPQQAERIFQMFQRLHERGKYPGSGIGLAISRRVVGRHQGRMWATSVPGQGATFYFTLPKRSSLRPTGVEHDQARQSQPHRHGG